MVRRRGSFSYDPPKKMKRILLVSLILLAGCIGGLACDSKSGATSNVVTAKGVGDEAKLKMGDVPPGPPPGK